MLPSQRGGRALGPLSYARSISGIDGTQAVSLEAIGFAIDAVDVVYRRLTTYLRDRLPPPTIVFADAWAMIDWMHRLDGLVEGCRGLTPRDEAVQVFLHSSSLVETLRHIYQHPENELRLTAETRRSIWGHLAWQRTVDGGHESFKSRHSAAGKASSVCRPAPRNVHAHRSIACRCSRPMARQKLVSPANGRLRFNSASVSKGRYRHQSDPRRARS